FLTGVGGFLQVFTYGFTGLRFDVGAVHLATSLPPQLPALTLAGVKWHGRVFDVRETRRRTVVTLRSGAPMPLLTPRGRRLVRRGDAGGAGRRRHARRGPALPAAPRGVRAARLPRRPERRHSGDRRAPGPLLSQARGPVGAGEPAAAAPTGRRPLAALRGELIC